MTIDAHGFDGGFGNFSGIETHDATPWGDEVHKSFQDDLVNNLQNIFAADAQLFNDNADGDLIKGTKLDDTLKGGGGDDTMNGREGNDVLNGRGGNDQISGGEGNDVLSGAAGTDVLKGGAGDDTLAGGKHNDVLFGGEGTDSYVFTAADNGSIDSIRDFDGGLDRIDVSALDLTFVGYSLDDFTGSGEGELAITFSATGSVVSADIDGNGTIDFTVNVKTVELTDSEIVF